MVIDTHNRDYNGPGFKAGLLPKSSLAPPDATWSGLLECPCTTRITKIWNYTYTTNFEEICKTAISNSSTCFKAVSTLITENFQESIVFDPAMPTGCVLDNQNDQYTAFWNTHVNQVTCPKADVYTGSAKSVVTLSVAYDTTVPGGRVIMTISGPSNVWFGVGFNARIMGDRPYAVVIDGNGVVSERKLGDHTAGTQLTPTQVLVLSNTVVDGTRTVVLSREFKGVTEDHYTFDPAKNRLLFINAVGRTATFSHHQFKGAGTVVFHGLDGYTCVCDNGIAGTINGIEFAKGCAPFPTSELLEQKNPSCFIQDYVGGIGCCLHEYILLDKDQPVDPRRDEIRLKFRIWFQDYQPALPPAVPTSDALTKAAASHENLFRIYFQTEAWSGEYDVPQCAAGLPPEDCVHQITSRLKVKDISLDCAGIVNCTQNKTGIKLYYANGHCHAPACISLELFNADTGALLCRQFAKIGTGQDKFDEAGYVNIPPCLWGSPEEGLMPPPVLTMETTLLSIKRNNDTNAHYGEMASWQMRGTYLE